VLDQWCHLGTVKGEDELRDLEAGGPARPLFDFDTYKILTRYLYNGKGRPDVVPLPPARASG